MRFAVILPLLHAIVSGLLLWSVPLPSSDGTVSFDLILFDPIQHRILFAVSPPAVLLAGFFLEAVDDHESRHRAPAGALLGCLFWWRLGLYIDRARRKEPINRSFILFCGTLLWTSAVWLLLVQNRGEVRALGPIKIAAVFSGTILWPALGFLAARDVRPRHLIS